ncbi:MAG TPA: amidohydrolase family protein [Candidatus Acidoferrales bacterium]|nr:amidohydrolase family protein [Candidatus Acidoferrales bacterium]
MTKDEVRSCDHGLSRRRMLQGGLAAAVTSVSGVGNPLLAEPATPEDLKKTGDRTIDIHAHYFPQTYFDLFNSEGRRYNAEFHRTEQGIFFKTPVESSGPLSAKFIDLKQRLADMDAQGVAVQALSLTGPMVYWADGEFSHKLAMTWNDAAVAAHQANPDRFVVLATLPMLDPDRAVDELSRVSKLPGVRGIYMGTNIEGRDLDDPLFEPIFTGIEALGLPVFLHPLPPILGGKRLQPYSLTNLVAFPLDTTVAAAHLIFGGVMDRHPNLLVVLPHAGGAVLNLVGRLDHGWNVIPAAKQSAQTPSAYLHRFRYDTIAHSKPVMEFIISQVGAERIMLGSDYCFPVGYDRPVEVVEDLHLTSDQRKMILGGTAAKILKI